MGLTRTFVSVNRIFGWAAAIGGALALAESVVRLVLGRSGLSEMAGLALTGLVFMAVGIVYIRAPLTRQKAVATDNSNE